MASSGTPDVFGSRFPVWVAPGDGYAAFEGMGRVLEVSDLRLADLLSRPMGEAEPADLDTVRALAGTQLGEAASATVELLRACLEHRFGS